MFMRRHNDVVACQILDPLEQTLLPPGLYGISNGTQLRFFNSRSAASRQRYRQFFETRQRKLMELTDHFAIPLLHFMTQGDLLQELRQQLQQSPGQARAGQLSAEQPSMSPKA